MLASHLGEFLFLEDFHAGDLEGLSAQDGKDWLDFIVEQEKFVIFDESLF